jgi:ABC-type xylose transport system, periplasmic component
MKRLLAFILCFVMTAALILTFTSCGGEKILVGISMPNSDSQQKWVVEGDLIKKGLEKSGYKVDLQYGDDTFATQMLQIESMIKAGVKALVITPADTNSLKTILEEAAKAEIFVILHDRMVMDVPYVTAFNTYNNVYVGALQAAYIIAALELETTDTVFNMEIFSGSGDDINASQVYSGSQSLLGKYIDSGRLNIVSGQRELETSIADWSRQGAYDRMKQLLETHYQDKEIHAVLAANDDIALGVIDALDEAGKTYPIIITGEGAKVDSIKSIIAGKQTMSVFKDPITLCNRTVTMADQILKGDKVDTTTVSNNGAKEIPTYETPLSIADIVSYKEVLIESGLFKESDFQ